MRLGKTLWLIILVKLFVIFVILKLFFFPNFIKKHAEEGQESEFVATQVLKDWRIEELKNLRIEDFTNLTIKAYDYKPFSKHRQ